MPEQLRFSRTLDEAWGAFVKVVDQARKARDEAILQAWKGVEK